MHIIPISKFVYSIYMIDAEVKKRNRYQNLSWQCSYHWARPPVNQEGGDILHVQVFDCDLH